MFCRCQVVCRDERHKRTFSQDGMRETLSILSHKALNVLFIKKTPNPIARKTTKRHLWTDDTYRECRESAEMVTFIQ